jgi:hypothetical protein
VESGMTFVKAVKVDDGIVVVKVVVCFVMVMREMAVVDMRTSEGEGPRKQLHT